MSVSGGFPVDQIRGPEGGKVPQEEQIFAEQAQSSCAARA